MSEVNPMQLFIDVAERDGMAATSTTDGYLLMFRRNHLQKLVLGTMENYISIGINTNGKVNTIKLSKSALQNELDRGGADMIAIVYTHDPLKN